jgi:hypothetical protein
LKNLDSIDVAHVPEPDPDKYWEFQLGKKIMVAGPTPYFSLELSRLESRRALFLATVDGERVSDWLNLNKPCVALRDLAGNPAVTITFREQRDGKAYLQITAAPHLATMPRSQVEQ